MHQFPYLKLRQSAYKPVWDLQEEILAHNLNIKKLNKTSGLDHETLSTLLLCEHLPVYTLGKSGKIENLKLSPEELEAKSIDYYPINRGGDITYHGPGQITGYPVFDLEQLQPSASWFIETMENAIIDTLGKFGITTQRIDGLTGVWVKGKTAEEDRKLCAIGVKMSRWVSIHGFALNVNTDLDYYKHIIPCGIDDKGVSSISKELGREVTIDEVEPVLLKAFEEHFDLQLHSVTLPHLKQQLSSK